MPKKLWLFLVPGILFGCAAPTSVVQPAPEMPPSDKSAVPANEREEDEEFEGLDDLERLALAHKEKLGPRPDSPGEAGEFRYRERLSENGKIPPNALMRAKADKDRMMAASATRDGGINNLSWTELGPGNIGGRIRSIIVHPTSTNTMWVGSVGGGIWKTTNGGTSWSSVGDFLPGLPIGCMAIDKLSPNTMYAGTGEGFGNSDSLPGAGIFKSIDGGNTWAQIATTIPTNPDPTQDPWGYVNRIAISPTNSLVILAATKTAIFRTANGGTSWTQVYGFRTNDVRFHPTNALAAVAGNNTGNVLWSSDGGVTWNTATGITAGGGRVEVTWALGGANMVYASVNLNSGQVYQSTDSGHTFTLKNTGTNYLGNQGWYDNVVWVDPTNSARIVVGGGPDLWRSTNSGTTLTRISQWSSAPQSAHADHHAVVNHPGYNGTTNRIVFFGNDGGIYKATDVTTVSLTSGWTSLNNNLAITQFYGGAVSANQQFVVGGTQDNGTLRTAGSQSWTAMFGGDGGWCAADPNDSNYLYGEYVYCRIHRSKNGGLSSSYIYSTGPAPLTDAVNANANFISPFITDPNNANRILAGAASLWRSNNVKAQTPEWYNIKNSISSNVSAITIAAGNPDLIWVGHNNGNVYKTINGTAAIPTWTRLDNNSPGLPDRSCKRIAIDPANYNRVYVSFSGYESNNMWRTDDGGANFVQITGPGNPGDPDTLPRAPVDTIALHQVLPGWLYVGTDIGVFASTDYGATWSSSNDGPANVAVDELIWRGLTKLVAVTHGRGMFEALVDTSTADCNGNSVPDVDDIAGGAPDCNSNGFLDSCEIAANPLFNCNGNALPDSCELAAGDCNGNLVLDSCELAANAALDCNSNDIIDSCEPAASDCNLNLVVDFCELAGQDCNANNVLDSCEMTGGFVGANTCANALCAVPNAVYGGTTVGATNDGSDSCNQAGSNPPDVWFKYEPASSGSATFSLCGSGYDSLMSIHSACPGTSANELDCDDDFCGGGSGSQVTINVTGGSTYYIRIAGFDVSTGDYQLRITGPTARGPNDCNSNGILDACEPDLTGPAITQQPDDVLVCQSQPASFTVTAVGMAPLSYQWKKNGANVGGNSPTYSIPSVTAGDVGNYTVTITNTCSSVTSDIATLALDSPPQIDGDPQNQSVCSGGTAVFTVVTSASPATFQWRRGVVSLSDGGSISGAQTDTLQISPAALGDAGNDYNCLVGNSCGSVPSANAILTVWPTGSGDLNADGSVNGKDIGIFVSVLLSPGPPSPTFCAADVNADQTVDLDDVPGFVALLLNP